MSSTKISKSASEISFSRYDSRNDLGYGRTSNKFHKPRSMGGSYPYGERSEFDIETEWEDEETHKAIDSKILHHQKSDPYSKKSTNPFYFAAGNTKLSDCFFRTDEILEEVHALSNSLVPVPGMTRKRDNFGRMNETENFDENFVNYTGVYQVSTEVGLLACHNGLNDPAFPGIKFYMLKMFIR